MDSRVEQLAEESRERFIPRREFMLRAVALGLTFSAAGSLLEACSSSPKSTGRTIKMGALIPLSGVESVFGPSMKGIATLAVDEVNGSGGVLGSKIDLIVSDTATDPTTSVQAARRLIQQDNVDVIIGTLTSADRWAVALEATDPGKTIFINPTYYEGGICNRYFFNVGAIPNQQIDPFIPWLVRDKGVKTFYLGGSDYAWPHGTFTALKSAASKTGATIVGEEYSPLGSTDFSATLRRMQAAKPEVIFPLYAGSDGIAFLTQLIQFGLQKNSLVASAAIDETILAALPHTGYESWLNSYEYYMNLNSSANHSFLNRYFSRYGSSSLFDAISEAMRTCVYLYVNGVKQANSLDKEKVVDGMVRAKFSDPKGEITIDDSSHCAHLSDYIAELQPAVAGQPVWKQFKIVKTFPSTKPVQQCLSSPPS
ncbi:MAG: substrate-binding protein [Nitrososphaerales archaeon]